MSFQVSPWRPAAVPILLGLILSFAGAQCLRAGPAATCDGPISMEVKQGAQARIVFPPELEVKYGVFLRDLKEARRKVWTLYMTMRIGDIARVTGLDSKGAAELEAAAKEAIEKCLNGWIAVADKIIREDVLNTPAKITEKFDRLISEADAIAVEQLGEKREIQLDEDARWSEAVKRTLTGDQASSWERALADRRNERAKECDDFLKPTAGEIRDQFQLGLLAKSASIRSTITLPKDRREALNALVVTAAEKCAEEWRESAAIKLMSMQDEQRRQMEMSLFLACNPPGEAPDQPAWKEGLTKVLNAKEFKRLDVVTKEHQDRRLRALAQVLLIEMDQKVAFTQSQRERLLPIAERMVNIAAFSPNILPGKRELAFSRISFFAASATASEKEMEAILDEAQWKRWKRSCDPKTIEAASKWGGAMMSEARDDGQRPLMPPEGDDLEAAYSEVLSEKTAVVRQRMLATMTLIVEDTTRLAALGPESSRRLQVAAQGATEQSFTDLKAVVEPIARSEMGDVSPESVKQRITSIEKFLFERDEHFLPGKQPVWEDAVKNEMTAEQRAKWKKEMEERNVFKCKSIASLILAEFDRKISISAEQWDKLEPILIRIENEYSPELGRFSSSQWYLLNPLMFTLLAAIPEEELSAILLKEQLDYWKATTEYAVSTKSWAHIQQMHAEHLKAKKS